MCLLFPITGHFSQDKKLKLKILNINIQSKSINVQMIKLIFKYNSIILHNNTIANTKFTNIKNIKQYTSTNN